MPINNDVQFGEGVQIVCPELVNLYGCSIGDHVMIGPFVEIQRGVSVGARSRVQSHSFLCEGVQLADEVFVGHGVMFTNDRWPRAANADGSTKTDDDWVMESTFVELRASIGSGATILPGVRLGEGCLVGAGAVVTKDVPPHAIVTGCPARVVGDARTIEPDGRGA